MAQKQSQRRGGPNSPTSSSSRRKATPQVSPSEVTYLLHIAAGHLAAMRAMMEEATHTLGATINNHDDTPTPRELIDKADLLTPQQASGIAVRDEKTIRRWHRDFGIGIVIGGTLFIRKSKLLAHLAHTKRSAE